MTRAVASFDVTGWDQGEPESAAGGPTLSSAVVRKQFGGDLVAESEARLMMCQADTSDISAGAGYIASEVVRGSLAGKQGTFVMQHWGLSADGREQTGGHVVPGSGTGDLKGLTGSVEISVDGEGAHTLTIDYELPDG
ncbi:DUF3224 domain-containing protein [Candidatus Palauibacter sp.]|uniref:DUF3224 domain-containing protein n=1 Tax=Candidatus Palauibacter sp. TaxID=3101350 RepID=UPI003C7057C9